MLRPTRETQDTTTQLLTSLFVTGACVLACGTLSAQQAGNAAAVVGGETVTTAKLDELASSQLGRLRAEEYAIRRRTLDEYVRRRLFEKEAERRKMTVDDLRRAEIDGKVKPVTDEEVQAIIEMRPENAPPQTPDQVRTQLQQQRLRRRDDEYFKALRERLGVKILLEAPRMAFDPKLGPSRGPAAAPVTLTVFSDFQCPYCARLVPTLRQMESKYPQKVRVVFRDFPLGMHKDAAKAAEAGRCAAEGGKFWEMHDKLFDNQRSLDVVSLKRYASEAGLDPAAFSACLDSGRQSAEVQKDVQEGNRVGVSGTPTVFVNGRMMPGASNPQALSEAIDEELALSGASERVSR